MSTAHVPPAAGAEPSRPVEPLRQALTGLWRELPQAVACAGMAGAGIVVQQLIGGLASPGYFLLLTLVTFPLLLALSDQVRRATRGEAVRVMVFLTSLPRALVVSCYVTWPLSLAGFLTQVAVFVWVTHHLTWVLLPAGMGVALTLAAFSWAVVSARVLLDDAQPVGQAGWTALALMARAPLPSLSLAASLVVTDWAYAHLGVVMLIAGPLLLALVWTVALQALVGRSRATSGPARPSVPSTPAPCGVQVPGAPQQVFGPLTEPFAAPDAAARH